MKRPIINILISIVLGLFCYILKDYIILSVIIIFILYFVVNICLYNSKINSFILILLVVIGFFVNYIYYESTINQRGTFKVKAENIQKKYLIGYYNKRKIKIVGNINNIKEGDNLIIKGTFKKDKNIEKGIVGLLFSDEKIKVGESKRLNLIDKFFSKLSDKIGEEKSAIVISSCLGEDKYLTENQKLDIKNLGIVHVMCVSGFHLTLIYGFLIKFLGFYPSIAITFLYVILTGGNAPSIRAFIMITLLNLGKRLRKNYDGLSALSFSAILLLLVNPYLIFDFGFNLSYFATLGILLFFKKIKRKLYKLPIFLNNIVSLSLSAQVFTFPLIALVIKEFSLNFIISNIFIVPIFTPLIIIGNLSMIFSLINPIFNFLSIILNLILLVLDGAMYIINTIAIESIIFNNILVYFYLSTLICVYMIKKGQRKFKNIPLILFIVSFFLIYSFSPRIIFFRDKYNKGIVIHSGFKKIFLTNSKNQYFIKNARLNYGVTEFIALDEDKKIKTHNHFIKIDRNLRYMYLQGKNKKIFFTENNENINKEIYCDIIFLSNEYEEQRFFSMLFKDKGYMINWRGRLK